MTLRAVSRAVSGKFQCEASADAPLFHTETSTAEMLVAELPAHKPIIMVHGTQPGISKKVIAIGELLKANCVSGPSYPPVNFTWIINGNIFPVSKKFEFPFFFFLVGFLHDRIQLIRNHFSVFTRYSTSRAALVCVLSMASKRTPRLPLATKKPGQN